MVKFLRISIGILLFLAFFVEIGSLVGSYRFNQAVKREVQALYENVENKHQVVSEEELEGLPDPVQTWLRKAQVLGRERIVSVRAVQDVHLRLEPDKPWMPAQAEQYFRTGEPGFIWKAKIKAAPLFYIAGRDKYIDGHGNMLIKVMSLFPIADATGPEIDQGTLLRYLAEIIWFPTAALCDYINWEQIDATSAQATMDYQGVTASGIFTFDDQTGLIRFEAERYRESGGKYRLEPWLVEAGDFKEFGGFVLPSRGRIIWKPVTGDFEWYRVTVKEIEYNQV